MAAHSGTVYIIDDDATVRRAFCRLIAAAGLHSVGRPSVDALLGKEDLSDCACLIADVRPPGTAGIDLPRRLADRGFQTPVILLTAVDSEEMRAEAKRLGAAGYFRKPVDEQALLDAIAWVIRDRPIGLSE